MTTDIGPGWGLEVLGKVRVLLTEYVARAAKVASRRRR